MRARLLGAVLILLGPFATPPLRAETGPIVARPSGVVLVTLDTARADALGCYGNPDAKTPVLDALAGHGTRYAVALSPAPLTLPAHTTLLTGLEPPEHGVRSNGGESLAPDVPTLATTLQARGWTTAAFVASRVLDRRFGLDRGFTVYDDRIAAERTGEYGLAERDAAAVTDAALAWLARLPAGTPYLLWVHYYDPHLPYAAPPDIQGSGPHPDYAAEVTYMDREIGRLLAALPGDPSGRLVLAVGDHGESLGEHGERGHGVFLYRAALEVPLILAGPGLPVGRVVDEPVAIRRLAATVLGLLGEQTAARELGPPLPGIEGLQAGPPRPAYSEARMPLTAYGWSPATALSDGRWRFVRAPRPELYDLAADRGETHNLVDTHPEQAKRLGETLAALETDMVSRRPAPVRLDAPTADALEALGYLTGASTPVDDGLDPKDGVKLLVDLDSAKAAMAAGRFAEAATSLERLVAKNPHNVPFLFNLALARLAEGKGEAALAASRRALALNPSSELLNLGVARTLARLGRYPEARAQYESALRCDPRLAAAWVELADLDRTSFGATAELATLRRALATGVTSATLLVRLGQVEASAGETASADTRLSAAVALVPDWFLPWLEWGRLAEAQGKPDLAEERFRRAEQLDPRSPGPPLALGRLYLARGETVRARALLRRATTLGRGAPEGDQAKTLLEQGE